MNIENPLAYSFILQDDIYLLNADKHSLKNTAPAAPQPVPVQETPKPAFKYLGDYKKQYLIISHYPATDFMEAAHLTALQSTLKRLGTELDDVAIFNLAGYPEAGFKQVIDFFKPQKVLILGNDALPPAMPATDQNKPRPLGNIRTLFTFSFAGMMSSVENKKEFWEAMKLF